MPGHCSIPITRPKLFLDASFSLKKSVLPVEYHDQKGAVQEAVSLMAFVAVRDPPGSALFIHRDEMSGFRRYPFGSIRGFHSRGTLPPNRPSE